MFLELIFFSLSPLVDQIYHLASPASPPNYMYNPIKTLKTNTIGTLNMLGQYAVLCFSPLCGNILRDFRSTQKSDFPPIMHIPRPL